MRLEQVREMLRRGSVTTIAGMLTACVVAYEVTNQVAKSGILLWLVALGALSLFRLVRYRRIRKIVAKGTTPRWIFTKFTASQVATGLLWLIAVFVWAPQVDDHKRMVLTLVTMGMMAGGSTMLSAIPPAAFALTLLLGIAEVRLSLFDHSWPAVFLSLNLTAIVCQSVLSSGRLFARHIRARMELEEQGQLIQLLREFQSSGSEWMWEVDAQLRVSFISTRMAESFGARAPALIGRSMRTILDPDGRHTAMSDGVQNLFHQMELGETFHELAVPTIDGQRWYCLSGRPVRDEAGQLTGWRGVGSDITHLRFGPGTEGVKVARRDPLTGLGNRLLVREMIEEARLRQLAGGEGHCVLLLLDLNRFKLVNDSLGHAIGDRLLVEVARRIETACGAEAGVGRLGGDEFAVIWRGSPDTLTLLNLAERICAAIESGFTIGSSAIHVGVSIGIARGPLDGETQDQLMRSADLALYRAKERQGGQSCFYEPWMLAKAQAERLLENDVREAVRRGDLRLHYQPIVDARSRRVVGHEALLRWWHPQRGAIGPDVFVPIIEDAGLIHEIGGWVIREACREAAGWACGERIAVNISVAQLTGAGLQETVEEALAATGLAPDRLELEVTESIFLGDDAATLAGLVSLQQLGVRLVLDDFGKGYSSFGYLARAHFAKIKIDQMFVRGAAAGQNDCAAIVQSILALASGLGVETTAEGVETEAHAQVMAASGCTQLQGYLFGRPVAATDMVHPAVDENPDQQLARRRA